MNFIKKYASIAVAACFLAGGLAAGIPAHAKGAGAVVKSAGGDKDAAPPVDNDTRLVVFSFDRNLVYNILTREGMMTHLELSDGEKIQGFYLSDSNRWKHLVSKDQTRVFIKPTQAGLFNSATMVTNQRVYELTFNAGIGPKDQWYQRVRWNISDFEKDGASSYEGVSEYARAPRLPRNRADNFDADMNMAPMMPAADVSGMTKVSPDKLNFGYVVTGTSSFRPISVFDDGKATWVQMGDSPTLPALFLVNEKGGMEIVNYTVHGRYLKISQVVPGLLFRLGDEEVRVSRKPACTGFWCATPTGANNKNDFN
jgi:type IV secretory pathway VirB9-like protein